MSEIKLISPMLDHFAVGDAISDHHGVRCYPAMEEATSSKYIVKVISVPASRTQLDALLLSGAYPDEASALVYFKELADGVIQEAEVLNRLSQQEGFLGYEQFQLVPMDDDIGFHIYLLGSYKRTLARQLHKQPMTYLEAINLGLDMCASLTVCRRYGYLYADLKPENIYVMEGGSYRIGDLGFLPLNSLRYASLPDKYRSAYTAPEISDAFCELNATIDVYAAGMILYQIFNNGELPAVDPENPAETLPAPANADYELSEIILKACTANPAARWEDPAQMGHALVSYMQRNGVNDTPIVPPVIPEPEPSISELTDSEEVPVADDNEIIADGPVDQNDPSDSGDDEVSPLPQDDELAGIAVLLESDNDETDPSYNEDEIDYDLVSDEISEMLTQADEIASHPVPDPVVAPEPIEVSVPVVTTVSEGGEDEPVDTQATIAVKVDSDTPSDESQDTVPAEDDTDSAADEPTSDADAVELESDGDADKPAKKKSHWLRNTILILLAVGILAAGVFFYTQYYLLPIESITLEGHEDTLTVQVQTTVDEKLLSVVCKDQHGNQLIAPVENGVAVFEDLIPDTGYTVTVTINGFHKLTGDYSKAYSTPVETNIAQFSAAAGYEDGTVVLAFTVDGRDTSEWSVLYSADGEEEKSIETSNKAVTISGLTIGKEYTFRLQPNTALFVTGQDEITFTATKLIYPQDLTVTGCTDGKMTVAWTAPKDTAVENWSVHCTDGAQYTETIISSKTTAEFDQIDPAKEYTITVTASGMSVSKQVIKPANAVSLTDMKLEQHATYAELTWNCSEDLNEDWFISFSVDGLTSTMTETTSKGYFRVPYIIPGAVYRVYIKGTKGTEPLGGTYVFTAATPKPSDYENSFNNKTVTAEDMTFSLCTPPSWNYWDRFDLDSEDYTTQFKAGQKAGLLIQLNKDYGSSWDEIVRVFAIYDQEQNLAACGYTTGSWSNMWSNGYSALDIPFMPEATGEYTMRLYFDGQFVTEQSFSIVE